MSEIERDEQGRVMVPCRECGGTGKVLHECDPAQYPSRAMVVLKIVYHREDASGSETLQIRHCTVCGQHWRVRFQTDYATGSDDHVDAITPAQAEQEVNRGK